MKQSHGGNVHAYLAEHGAMPLDFSANINPLGMPEAVLQAAKDALPEGIHYPDPGCNALCQAIARAHNVPREWVLCGNGAADLIYRFAYAVRPKTALVCAPTFSEYAHALYAAGCCVKEHMLAASDGFCLTESIFSALDGVDALFLCNPNNPTGTTIEPSLLDRVLKTCHERNIQVLLDECFVPFVDEPEKHTCISSLASYPNVLILRAFTKLYAMPGLRLGYVLCSHADMLGGMQRAGAPWSVGTVAQSAGLAALCCTSYPLQTRTLVQRERIFLKQMLRSMGLQPLGEANYLFFSAREGLAEALRDEGILIRDCENFAGLTRGSYRIAVKTRQENAKLLLCLGRCLHG